MPEAAEWVALQQATGYTQGSSSEERGELSVVHRDFCSDFAEWLRVAVTSGGHPAQPS